MNNELFMGGPMPYRGGGVYSPSNAYAPSFLSTQMGPMQNNNTNIVWTMGLESAKAYPLMPGRTLMLMDSESPRFFIKAVDSNGYATLKAYSFQEEQPIHTPSPVMASANWVTKEQLDAAINAILTEVRQKAPAEAEAKQKKEEVEVEVEKTKTTNKNLL